MPWLWCFASLALANPRPVVALGDGLVVGAPVSEVAAAPAAASAHRTIPAVAPPADAVEKADKAGPTVAGGWVSILADCLEERQPGAWVVLDRSAEGQTAAEARRDVPAVRELKPALVLVGVGVPTGADETTFRADLTGLVRDLRAHHGPDVLLVGSIPPTLSQIPDNHLQQAEIDRRARAWDADIEAIAAANGGVQHVDLFATWPADDAKRARLTVLGTRLSDQGHARVAAQVCDAVIAWRTANEH